MLPDRLEERRRIVEVDGVLEAADLLGADRRDQILRRERIGDVLAGQAARLHGDRIDVDLHLALLAAIRVGDGRAGDGDERGADEIDAEVGEHLLGQAFTRQRELDDGDRGGVVVDDQRRQRAGRHLAQQRLRDRGDLRVGDANVRAWLEEDLNDAEPGVGRCFGMLDVVDGRGQHTLELGHHAAGHLVRRQAGVVPDRRDHRDADFRENVDRRAPSRERADNEKEQGKHDKRVRAPQRDADELSHFRCRLPSSRAMVELALLRHGPPIYAAPSENNRAVQRSIASLSRAGQLTKTLALRKFPAISKAKLCAKL